MAGGSCLTRDRMENSMTEPTSPDQRAAAVERIAKALYENAVEQARTQIATEIFPTDKIMAVFEKAVSASDREASSCILLVDDLCTDFFRRKLTGNVSSGVDEAFLAGNGMLASTHNKIALLAGLEWIRNETYRNLTFMRRIRNEFAHHVEYSEFVHSPICNYIDAMTSRENNVLNGMDADRRPVKLLMRTKFLVRSVFSVYRLVREMSAMQAALAHNVPPGSLFMDFDDQPENLKDLSRIVARLTLQIILEQPPTPPA